MAKTAIVQYKLVIAVVILGEMGVEDHNVNY